MRSPIKTRSAAHVRDHWQAKEIDGWQPRHQGQAVRQWNAYPRSSKEIGICCRSPRSIKANRPMCDEEIGRSAAAARRTAQQNARYAVNAATTLRLGQPYGRLLGTDAIPARPQARSQGFNTGARRQGHPPRPRRFSISAVRLRPQAPRRHLIQRQSQAAPRSS